MEKYQNRGEVTTEYKWDLTSFFKDEEEFNKVFKDTEVIISKLNSYVGCTKDSIKLKEFLELQLEAI